MLNPPLKNKTSTLPVEAYKIKIPLPFSVEVINLQIS
jgi:hypothetical protein